MTNYSIRSAQEKLERIYELGEAKVGRKIQFAATFRRFLNTVFAFAIRSDEPRVSIRRDRLGNKIYHAYDPVSDRSFSGTSEADLRSWLESRYYQQ